MRSLLSRIYAFEERLEVTHPFLHGLITFLLAAAAVALTAAAFLLLVLTLEACGGII